MRLAVDAPAERCPANSNALRISLDMAGLAAAAPYALTVVSGVGTSGSAHNLFEFHQGGPFAVASVQTATGSAALPRLRRSPRPSRPYARLRNRRRTVAADDERELCPLSPELGTRPSRAAASGVRVASAPALYVGPLHGGLTSRRSETSEF